MKNITEFLFKSKKYWIIYLVFILITCMSALSANNSSISNFLITTFFIVAVVGVLCIVYYFMHDSENELYKVAFVIILCFGIMSSMIVPICDVSDELEHLTRAEITSQGVIFPHWEGGKNNLTQLYNETDTGRYSNKLNTDVGFYTSQSHMFFLHNLGKTVYDTQDDTEKISDKQILDGSAFEQNPFYGYVPQAIGIFIAKMLDLSVMWMLWLGRIFNLLCYAGLISLAVKKAPVFKIQLLAVACIPISLYQAASISIDSMIIGLGILAIAYFLYLYKAKAESLDTKHIAIFCGLCLLLGLCKLPYLAFVFLILFVPKSNFKNKNAIWFMLLGILIVGGIGVLWSTYSQPALMHSWRSKLNTMDAGLQAAYLMDHPSFVLRFLKVIFTTTLGIVFNGFFNFFSAGNPNHYADHYTLITTLIWIFLVVTLLFYPNRPVFNHKSKIGALLVILIVYVGTCFIQLLTWADVGAYNIGVSTRYFLPLFGLLPIVVAFNPDIIERLIGPDRFGWLKDKYDTFGLYFNKYSMIFIIGFLASMILAFATKYY